MDKTKKQMSIFELWKQFLPLSVSDVTMACSDPMITTTLAHMPQAISSLGALGAAKAIAVFFESPVIMMLHASNRLAPSQTSRKALKSFMLIACSLLTLALALLCVPPVFDFFVGFSMRLPADIAKLAKDALIFFILWPAAIGWRRYYQGLLIRYHHARAIANAGFLRLLVVAVVLALGFYFNAVGVRLAGTALIGGVLVEALAVTLAAKKFGVTMTPALVSDPRLPHDLKSVWKFYWPLANSMLVVWGGRALLFGVIARSIDGPIALAAWPAAWGFVLVVANATRMVQQVIIKNRSYVKDKVLFSFAASVGGFFSFILIFIAVTVPGQSVIKAFVGLNQDLVNAVTPVVLLCSIVPFLIAIQNAIQGFLMTEQKTGHINAATWLGTAVLLSSALLGIKAGLLGATAAASAMVFALASETTWLFLGLSSRAPLLKNERLTN
jgi:hypothetical protein